MARIELAPEVAEDIERIYAHLAEDEVDSIASRSQEIIQAIAVLEQNPLIGQQSDSNNQALIIGRDSRGYVALYRYIDAIDSVFVLALRRQREAGYARD